MESLINVPPEPRILVSIILVNYNGADVLPACLNSLAEFIPQDTCEIILVDNNSQDHSIDYVTENFPEIKIIRMSRNCGFGAGNNAGAKISRGKFLFLLNTDTILTNNIIPHLIDLMQKRQEVGIVGTKLLFPNQSFQISVSPTIGIKGEFKSRRLHKYAESNCNLNFLEKDYQVIKEVDIVVGASLFIRAELFDSLGGFDESFFMYFEDSDLCQRVQNKGYKIIYTPEVSVIHIRGHSMKKNANAMAVEYRRSQIYYYQKHRPDWEMFILKVYLFIKFISEYIQTKNSYALDILRLLGDK
ncbi:glycosyltransferase family 2 protein [Nodularia harveyana UHCC-0300]|uniref:Glycosyltransferase family 2 protein n=1 Tax=Nodularia harveyana UHCC-0300 TaxID=2974287 RepID=A0ABU5UI88_9CYAN|nr:glycosyltransferase family 2 protein [Nodularia harveyana]MEA5582840.1 glycosyltransferase family 2 protein [Nodularia harveyana UHCC-0300]